MVAVTLGEQQEKRTTRALIEGPEMQWTKSPLGWVVSTPSGGCYQVSEKGCSCPDYQRNCAGVELSCKHQIALRHKLLAENGPEPRAMNRIEREDAAFQRLYG